LRKGLRSFPTGGTARLLAEAGVSATEVSDYTGFPEMLDGRVKTLHPKIHAGLLARRDSSAHMQALRGAGMEPIDLVVVNLYPFSQTVAKAACTFEDAIENIDIGGPTMLRAAGKNHGGVAVVVDPADYPALLEEMQRLNGALGAQTRFRLAQKVFAHTAAYDAAIANYLTALDDRHERAPWPGKLTLQFEKLQDMRYGENPQPGGGVLPRRGRACGKPRQLPADPGQGVSYNNIADSDAAWECVKTFREPACVIIKHANPCGVAVAADALEAYKGALATDPTSAFAASSRSTARSTHRLQRRLRSSSSRW